MPAALKKANRAGFQLPTHKQPIVTLNDDTREMLRQLPDDTFQCVVASPPYWGQGITGQRIRLARNRIYINTIERLVAVFRELRGALKPDGTFWLDIGNTCSSGGRKWRDVDDKN